VAGRIADSNDDQELYKFMRALEMDFDKLVGAQALYERRKLKMVGETLFNSFLERFFLENPGAEDRTEDIRCTTDEIRHIEKELRVALPNQYKSFLQRVSFFQPINIFRCGKNESIVDHNDDASGLAHDLVAFAGNGCGDYYCFRVVNGRATDEVRPTQT